QRRFPNVRCGIACCLSNTVCTEKPFCEMIQPQLFHCFIPHNGFCRRFIFAAQQIDLHAKSCQLFCMGNTIGHKHSGLFYQKVRNPCCCRTCIQKYKIICSNQRCCKTSNLLFCFLIFIFSAIDFLIFGTVFHIYSHCTAEHLHQTPFFMQHC